VIPGSSPGKPRATTTEGARARSIEEGSTESLRNRGRKTTSTLRIPCPSLGRARPMLPGTAMSRAPFFHRGGRHRAHRPRRVSGDAPARGTRRRLADGMAPRRHLTVFTGRARSRQNGASRTRASCKTPGKGERADARTGSDAQANGRCVLEPGRATVRQGERGQGQPPRAEEDSRLAVVPARRKHCVAEIGGAVAAQRNRRSFSPPRAVKRTGGRRGLGRG
jgi:hypothetical protein